MSVGDTDQQRAEIIAKKVLVPLRSEARAQMLPAKSRQPTATSGELGLSRAAKCGVSL
jgi:hypothetical protein